MANDANTHGYRWPDGTVHDTPHPRGTDTAVAREPQVNAKTGTFLKPPTEEQYAKAYAEWVREFNAWKAKYGQKD